MRSQASTLRCMIKRTARSTPSTVGGSLEFNQTPILSLQSPTAASFSFSNIPGCVKNWIKGGAPREKINIGLVSCSCIAAPFPLSAFSSSSSVASPTPCCNSRSTDAHSVTPSTCMSHTEATMTQLGGLTKAYHSVSRLQH